MARMDLGREQLAFERERHSASVVDKEKEREDRKEERELARKEREEERKAQFETEMAKFK